MSKEPEEEIKATGRVKWFKSPYGFITTDNDHGEGFIDVFVHFSVIPPEVILREGDRVEIVIEKTEKGLNAKSLIKIQETFVDL